MIKISFRAFVTSIRSSMKEPRHNYTISSGKTVCIILYGKIYNIPLVALAAILCECYVLVLTIVWLYAKNAMVFLEHIDFSFIYTTKCSLLNEYVEVLCSATNGSERKFSSKTVSQEYSVHICHNVIRTIILLFFNHVMDLY